MDRHDIDWQRLDRYVAGEGTTEELEELRRWVASDPELQVVAEVMRTAQRLPDAGLIGWNARTSWGAVADRLGLPSDVTAAPAGTHDSRRKGNAARPVLQLASLGGARHTRQWRVAAALVAAAAVVVLGADWLTGRELTRAGSPLSHGAEAGREYVTGRGQRLLVHLPDRTEITLAPESRLRLSPGYGRDARDVELQGHAYFVVTHDSARPFSVRTERLIARDLGTRFVIRAYPGDSAPAAVVAEGLVALGRSQAPDRPLRDSLLLEAGDVGRVTAAGDLVRQRDVPVEEYLAWTSGELRFRGMPLRDVVGELGRWYDIEVRLAEASFGNEEVTASFKDEPAPTAVGLIAAAAGLVVDQRGTQFTLRRKQR